MDGRDDGVRAAAALSERACQDALAKSLRDTHDLLGVAEAIEAGLGDRVWSDPWASSDDSRVLYLRDLALGPGWLHPTPIFELRLDTPTRPTSPSETPRAQRDPGRVQRTATGTFREGRAVYQVCCDAVGNAFEWTRSCGDGWGDGAWSEERPFAVDHRLLWHPQPPPISFLCRADLDADFGHPHAEVARFVGELDPGRDTLHRVFVPTRVPGGAQRCGVRATSWLRRALFDGFAQDWRGAGWVVIDAVDGSVRAVGPTLALAFARWREEVERQPPPAPPEPAEDHDDVELPDPEDVHPKGYPRAAPVAFAAPGWSWERPLPPAHVPAVAFPIEPLPVVPDRLALRGFSRAVRQVGDEGEPWSAFVRPDAEGFTMVGERAAAMVDADLDEQLDADRARCEREVREVWGADRDPLWTHWAYTTLASDGRSQVAPRLTIAARTASRFDTAGIGAQGTFLIFRAAGG